MLRRSTSLALPGQPALHTLLQAVPLRDAPANDAIQPAAGGVGSPDGPHGAVPLLGAMQAQQQLQPLEQRRRSHWAASSSSTSSSSSSSLTASRVYSTGSRRPVATAAVAVAASWAEAQQSHHHHRDHLLADMMPRVRSWPPPPRAQNGTPSSFGHFGGATTRAEVQLECKLTAVGLGPAMAVIPPWQLHNRSSLDEMVALYRRQILVAAGCAEEEGGHGHGTPFLQAGMVAAEQGFACPAAMSGAGRLDVQQDPPQAGSPPQAAECKEEATAEGCAAAAAPLSAAEEVANVAKSPDEQPLSPRVLPTTVHGILQECCAFTKAAANKFLKKNPQLGALPLGQVLAVVECLEHVLEMTPADLAQAVRRSPLLLGADLDAHLLPLFIFLQDLGLSTPQLRAVLCRPHSLHLPSALGQLEAALAFWVGKGFTRAQFAELLCTAPEVGTADLRALERKLQWMEEEAGLAPAEVASEPGLLTHSLGEVVGPRLAFAIHRGCRPARERPAEEGPGISPRHPGPDTRPRHLGFDKLLVGALMRKDKNFCNYVHSSQEEFWAFRERWQRKDYPAWLASSGRSSSFYRGMDGAAGSAPAGAVAGAALAEGAGEEEDEEDMWNWMEVDDDMLRFQFA